MYGLIINFANILMHLLILLFVLLITKSWKSIESFQCLERHVLLRLNNNSNPHLNQQSNGENDTEQTFT